MTAPELIVTNLNPRFTGVSATTAAVVRAQASQFDLWLVGHALPGAPKPISKREALRLCRSAPLRRPCSIWHVRRNTEMRLGLWARDVLRLPIRLVFTSAAIRRHSALPRWLISRMDAVIATTPEAANFVPGVRAIAPHGVDTNVWYPAPNRNGAWTTLGYPGRLGVATIGRIRPEKGTDRFVDAMLRVLPRQKDVTALVIGAALGKHKAFEADLRARIHAAGLSDRILFLGELPADKLPQIMRALSLLIALPRYEGYGMTPLEGMASGVPFVASNTGYFQTFSAQNTAGVVVDDVSRAADHIDQLLNNQEMRNALSKRAREVAASCHSIDREVDEIARVYHDIWQEAAR